MADPTDPEPYPSMGYVRGTTIPYPDLRASAGGPPAWFVKACSDHRARGVYPSWYRGSKAPGASDSSLGEGVDPLGDPTTFRPPEAPPQSLQLSCYRTTRTRSPKRFVACKRHVVFDGGAWSDFNTYLHRQDQAIPDNLALKIHSFKKDSGEMIFWVMAGEVHHEDIGLASKALGQSVFELRESDPHPDTWQYVEQRGPFWAKIKMSKSIQD